MKCSKCNKEIVLVPSAEERARKFGGTANQYIKLFSVCTTCKIKDWYKG